MAFNNFVPPLLNREQSGALPDLIGDLLSSYTQSTEARNLKPKLKEALTRQQLENKYYGADKESEINVRGKQADYYGQQAKYHGPEVMSQIGLRNAQVGATNAEAKTKQLIANILAQVQGSGNQMQQPNENPVNAPVSQQNQGIPQQVGNQQQVSNEIQKQITPPNQKSQNGLTYAQAAIASHAAGIAPTIVESNGRQVAITPFGSFDTGVSGPTTEEKSFKAALGTAKAKFYDDSVAAYQGFSNQGLALDSLKDSVENNPQFRNVVGRLNKPLKEWFGTPEQKKLLGDLMTSSGEIVLQVAPTFKGSFRQGEQSLINSIKAGPSDFADVFIGKLASQSIINNALKDRAKLQAQFVEQGMSELQAADKAAEATPLSAYKSQVESLIHPKPRLTIDQAKDELARRQIRKQMSEGQ